MLINYIALIIYVIVDFMLGKDTSKGKRLYNDWLNCINIKHKYQFQMRVVEFKKDHIYL